MDDIIAKSKEAHSALDQLGNTEISFDYFQGKFDESIAQARLNAKNKQLEMTNEINHLRIGITN